MDAGIIITSLLVVFAWGYLIYNGDIATIWPMFGVANQLLATIALAVGTTVILTLNKKRVYALITFIPMLFMLVTTGHRRNRKYFLKIIFPNKLSR